MKISINKNELQSALQKLSKATPNRSTLPILSCVLLQTKNNETILRSTDLEITIIISISASVEREGSSAIPIHTLINITNELPDGRITIEIDDQHKIKLITELGTYNLMGKPAEEFPAVPEIDEEKPLPIKADLLSEIIKSTSFVISHDDLKPALTGLYLKIEKNRLTTVATDGHQLVRYIVNDYVTDGFTGEVIIPRKFLSLLGSLLVDDDKTQLWISTNHATATSEGVKVLTRIIDERYPDYESVIPKENKKKLVVNKERFLGAVKRTSIFSNKMTHQISITPDKDTVLIKTEDPETASRGQEKMKGEFSGEPLTIGYNANYLKDIVSHINDENVVIKMDTPISSTLFNGETIEKNRDITMLLMPIRLND